MKTIKTIFSPFALTVVFCLASVFTFLSTSCKQEEQPIVEKKASTQKINMFVTHGHCSVPFTGDVDNLNFEFLPRTDFGNPLEGMKLSFDINPRTLTTCSDSSMSEKLRQPGLFYTWEDENMSFKTTSIHTMGLDWYQINGTFRLNGVERNVKFFATGIRNPNDTWPTQLVLEGQLNLMDWGINFDQFISGETINPSKWFHLNMKLDLQKYSKC